MTNSIALLYITYTLFLFFMYLYTTMLLHTCVVLCCARRLCALNIKRSVVVALDFSAVLRGLRLVYVSLFFPSRFKCFTYGLVVFIFLWKKNPLTHRFKHTYRTNETAVVYRCAWSFFFLTEVVKIIHSSLRLYDFYFNIFFFFYFLSLDSLDTLSCFASLSTSAQSTFIIWKKKSTGNSQHQTIDIRSACTYIRFFLMKCECSTWWTIAIRFSS